MSSLFRRHPHPDDVDTDEEDDGAIDPDLRLRTVRTASSAIAESIRSEARMHRRKTKFNKSRSRFFGGGKGSEKKEQAPEQPVTTAKVASGKRRNIYVNMPLGASEVKPNGDPIVRYARNKVRTSKYTILTFVPKNLYEQFRRVANLYFLALVCIQVFPLFGAAAPQISMIPLVVILTITAIKDGVEDYRRASLDEEVNNSASTKLGGWRNVNQPKDGRAWYERILGINGPDSVSRGVRKLREKEAGEGKIVLAKASTGNADSSSTLEDPMRRVRSLEDIQSVASSDHDHTYPPIPIDSISSSITSSSTPTVVAEDGRARSGTVSSYTNSTRSGVSTGVVNWNRRTGGAARWERTLWKKLEVGDIVLLRDNDQVPADIVVLSTSDSDGMCYIETKNLDGETNLKPRKSLRATSSITSEEDLEHSSFMLDSEPPHPNLYMYNGVLKYRSYQPEGQESAVPPTPRSALAGAGVEKVEPVTINELLLRGCAVRNTNWIIGLVVFTGPDTKIMLNGGDTPSKRSKIEKETNFNVVMNFLILIAMCTVTAIVSGHFETLTNTSADFFEIDAQPTDSVALNSLITFASCLIAFQNIVPISLYISIEIVKTIQAYFINQDIDMYYAPYDTSCVPKTWNISDDLGQIEYIFSDKTGTLTQNVMEFQKCSVHGVPYGEGITEAMRGAAKREGRDDALDPEEQAKQIASLKDTMLDRLNKAFKNRYLRPEKLTLVSPQLAEHLADRSGPQRSHLIAFFRALAICHTVLSDKPDATQNPYILDYKAESPDEAALVGAARDVGFPFVGRTNNSIDIEVMGQAERYTPLRVLEFNSTRKRMSVIVRNPEGKIILYCKGADSVIYARLAADQDPAIKQATSRDMEAFANGGLRTLCIAYKTLSEEEYFDWTRVYDAAAAAIKDREEAIEKANELIEKGLYILGATALEDKLQEGVPEAIETLHQAGIKLWILTGDKLQTAIEIGFSCNLLKSDMDIMILSADTPDAARSQIEAGLNKIASVLGPPRFGKKELRGFTPGQGGGFAVVIDGDTLRYALEPALKPLFLNLGTQCETVVCCRVSPAQKAMTVKLVKEGRNAMTLSIGDGANDVAMIQEANIGCGLFGLEGSQAAMSADYAFGQFRFLTKLLLVHGRWSYIRIADMHSNFFYKNVIWTFAMFWYLFWNSFDATYLYEYTFILLYNLVFTSLPVIVLGAFDQDINAKASLAFPQLYVRGIRGLEYTRTQFWLYMLDGLYQSAVVYFIPYLSFSSGLSTSWNGKGLDSLADFGTTVSVAAIWAANLFVGMNIRYWTAITWIIIVGSMLVLVLWITIYSFFTSIQFNEEIIVLFSTMTFWATVILSVILAIGPRFIMKFASQAYFPMDKDIVREMWVVGDLKDRLGIRHRKDKKKNLDPEDLSLFQPHIRSGSEMSDVGRGEYTLAGTRSPPPIVVKPSPPEGHGQDAMDHRTPRVEAYPAQPTPQSAGLASFYSASEIPMPSPMQSPGGSRHATTSPPPPSNPGISGRRLSVIRGSEAQASEGGDYEMRVRSPDPRPLLHAREETDMSRASRGSNASFVTADDGQDWDDRGDDRETLAQQGDRRLSTYSDYTAGPHAL